MSLKIQTSLILIHFKKSTPLKVKIFCYKHLNLLDWQLSLSDGENAPQKEANPLPLYRYIYKRKWYEVYIEPDPARSLERYLLHPNPLVAGVVWRLKSTRKTSPGPTDFYKLTGLSEVSPHATAWIYRRLVLVRVWHLKIGNSINECLELVLRLRRIASFICAQRLPENRRWRRSWQTGKL